MEHGRVSRGRGLEMTATGPLQPLRAAAVNPRPSRAFIEHVWRSARYGNGDFTAFAKVALLDTCNKKILPVGPAGVSSICTGEQMRNIIFMKPDFNARCAARSSFKTLPALALGAGLLLWALVRPTAAYAGLGESSDSIARDRAAMRSSLNTVSMKGYDVHELTSESGAMVREYATLGGTVFALTWSGTQLPDLKLLLSAYYDRYVTAAQAHRTGHHVLSIATPELVMTVVKFQRKSSGQAYAPSLMPSGVTRQELR
jgi:hypothetical protein